MSSDMHISLQSSSKRKLAGDTEMRDAPTMKKQRVRAEVVPETSHYLAPYEPILAILRPKYDIKTMSIMSSTSINKHVNKALEHLGRFSAWDQSVLPGIVFFSAKFATSNKLTTISELLRRRIGESEQKWYQYNVLEETEYEQMEVEVLPSANDANHVRGNDDDYFESMKSTVHDRAIHPPRIKHTGYVSTMFSRVPLDELKSLPNVTVQTNEKRIEMLRRKRPGMAP